jgi:hypothetical protein
MIRDGNGMGNAVERKWVLFGKGKKSKFNDPGQPTQLHSGLL